MPAQIVHGVDLVLLVAAAVCFALAAGQAPSRFNLMALGLLLWELVSLIAALALGPGPH